MGRGTVREADGGGAAKVVQLPLRQRFALPPPHRCATGRIKIYPIFVQVTVRQNRLTHPFIVSLLPFTRRCAL